MLVINGLDNEFAVSSGSNVNDGAGTSTFDYPPTSTSNLTISANEGDQSPYIFDVGDTYDITWTGHGGGTIEDATVVRSDPVSFNGDSGHAVVFEGLDEDGETVQVVWSPEFDLESWYFDNFNQGQPPGFWNSDTNAAESFTFVCFAPGARIAVAGGEKRVEELLAGDQVETLDNGVQTLRWAGRRRVSARRNMAPVHFVAGAVGNDGPLTLSPQHRLLVRAPEAEALFGLAEVLVPAIAFVGLPGVTRHVSPHVTYIHLLFDRHEILSVEGVGCESLLLGDMALGTLIAPQDDSTSEAVAILPDTIGFSAFHGMKAARPVLRSYEAALLLENTPPKVLEPAMF